MLKLHVLIHDNCLRFEGFAVDPLDHQGDFVVFVESVPVSLERFFGVGENRHELREAVERRNRLAVRFVRADEVTKPRECLLELERHAFAASVFAVVTALENGELIDGRFSILVMDARDARREVRGIVFVLASAESAFEGTTEIDGVINRVRLVAVRDNLHVLRVAGWIINDEVRVRELRFVESLRLHESRISFDFENAVAAVHAAAHDPVNLHKGLTVGARAKHDAASRIRILGEFVEILFCFVDVRHSRYDVAPTAL